MIWWSRSSSAVLLATALLAGCATGPTPQPEQTTNATDNSQGGAEKKPISVTKPDPMSEEAKQVFQKGLEAMRNENYETARSMFTRLIDEHGDHAVAYVNLGIAQQHLDDEVAAQHALESAIKVAPNRPAAYNQLGILHRKAGRFDAARQTYEKALKAAPNDPFAHHNLGVLCDLYLQDWNCALEHYRQYQKLTEEEDKQVKIWIADLSRRMEAAQ